MKTFRGSTAPSLTDLDENFEELSRRGDLIGPQSFGAKCDLTILRRAYTTAGSAVFNTDEPIFTGADVGKTIAITGAGVAIGSSVADGATLYGPLVTTIAGINSPTQIIMADAAGRTVNSAIGVQYIRDNLTVEGAAKAFFGTDDTAALQEYVDYAHWRDGIVRIPNPGCMVLGTIYCQRMNSTAVDSTIFRRLEFRGVGPAARVTLTGLASNADSNLCKPTPGNILTVNIDATGAGMTSSGGSLFTLFSCFAVNGIAFHGMPGVLTTGIKLHAARADIEKTSFNCLWWGWNGIDPDVTGAANYCDQWRVDKVNFNNCSGLFKQAAPDATEWRSLAAESFYPTVANAIEILGGRGWEIRAILVNNLPISARIGLFTECKEGSVRAGHFESIWGNAFRVIGSNSKSWVDIYGCDFYHPVSASTGGVTAHTIHYSGAGGTVERCGFSHKRSAAGFDIYFQTAAHQSEKNNHYYEADNITWRKPSSQLDGWGGGVYGNIGTSLSQQYFVKIVYVDGHFDILNVGGFSIVSAVMNSYPRIDGNGDLNLDGPRLWGRPNIAIVSPIADKYTPVLKDVIFLRISWYDSSGTKITSPDANMSCYLLVS